MESKDIKYIVVHCSATDEELDVGVDEIRAWHKEKGWSDVGYHYVIRRNGQGEIGRGITEIGAHVKGHNKESIGICLVGGVNETGQATNNFTPEQFNTLEKILIGMKAYAPDAKILGHRDLSPDTDGDGIIEEFEWMKACPSFEVSEWLEERGIT